MPVVVLNGSGMYKMVPAKKADTIYETNTPTTVLKKRPNTVVIMFLVGDE